MTKQVVCPVCVGCGFVPVIGEHSASSHTCDHCNGAGEIEIPMTHADRIRAMSDEELAVFLERTQADVAFNNKSKYAFEWGKWLKQPAE